MITRVLKSLWRVERKALDIHVERCTHNRHQLAACRRCVDACPAGALELDEGLQIDVDRCVQCGTCAAVCPTGALEFCGPSDTKLLGSLIETLTPGAALVFGCDRNGASGAHPRGGVVAVPCIGRIDESLLLGTIALGASAVYLLDEGCARCPHAGGAQVAREVVVRANRLLAALGRPQAIAVLPWEQLPDEARLTVTGGSAAVSRRELLRRVMFGAAAAGGEAMNGSPSIAAPESPRPGSGVLPVVVPEKRALLLWALRKLQPPPDAKLDAEDLVAQVIFSPECTVCGMCAQFCPTGALFTMQRDGRQGVAYLASRCVDCNLCIDVCYMHAVSHAHQLPIEELFETRPTALVWGQDGSSSIGLRSTARLEKAARNALGL